MENYVGMNFQEWAKLDEEDTREMHIVLESGENTSYYSSYDEITPLEMGILQESTILAVLLISNEWFIRLHHD